MCDLRLARSALARWHSARRSRLDSGWPAPEAEAARSMNGVNGNGHHGGREIDQLISREERLALKQPPNDEEAELACVAAEMYAPGSLERVGVVRSAFYH